jgi:V/A-type H+-transporting ATPase subunit C
MRLIGTEIDLQNIKWVIRLKSFYNLGLDEVMAAVVQGGFSVGKNMIEHLYTEYNVEHVLQELIKNKYPGLSALLGSPGSDNASRLLLIRQILHEIIKHEVQKILSGYPFTIGIILAYFILKQEELKRVRMVLNAKQYGIDQERIESMI